MSDTVYYVRKKSDGDLGMVVTTQSTFAGLNAEGQIIIVDRIGVLFEKDRSSAPVFVAPGEIEWVSIPGYTDFEEGQVLSDTLISESVIQFKDEEEEDDDNS